MSAETRIAPGGKATQGMVAYVRRYGVDASEARGLPLSRRQLQRIAAGRAWANGWLPSRLPDDETRTCEVCGKVFSRRFKSGRMRCDRLWAQKKTCGRTCHLRRAWAAGAFDKRARPTRH